VEELTTNIKSVNFHLWEPCNMRCKFCFATFQDVKSSVLPKGHLDKESTIQIIDKLVDAGFEKITFAGGEPTLCKWLPELIERAKEGGLTTMLVTNGSILTESYLRKLNDKLDWVVLSIDSLNTQTNIKTGRTLNRKPFSKEKYLTLIENIKQNDIRFKMNTVVTSKNYDEDLTEFFKNSYSREMESITSPSNQWTER
jgi:radical S-adenosyl methionine domain-containing protein 2